MGWALITGASSGLGMEFARLAAADGHDLILSARSTDALESLAATLSDAHGITALAIPADLSQPGEADRLWETAGTGREIDILVNNAGLGSHGPFGSETARDEQAIAVNVVAYSTLMARAVPAMKARGAGKILNVASAAGFMAGPTMAVYHASKAYALFLSEAVAQECAGSGVTVTALCPGPTKTGFFEAARMNRTLLTSLLPMGDAATVARSGWGAMKSGRRIRVPGLVNKIVTFATRLLPRRLLTPLTGWLWSGND